MQQRGAGRRHSSAAAERRGSSRRSPGAHPQELHCNSGVLRRLEQRGAASAGTAGAAAQQPSVAECSGWDSTALPRRAVWHVGQSGRESCSAAAGCRVSRNCAGRSNTSRLQDSSAAAELRRARWHSLALTLRSCCAAVGFLMGWRRSRRPGTRNSIGVSGAAAGCRAPAQQCSSRASRIEPAKPGAHPQELECSSGVQQEQQKAPKQQGSSRASQNVAAQPGAYPQELQCSSGVQQVQ